MQYVAPIKYRGNNSCKICSVCGETIKEPEGITADAYYASLSVFNEIDFINNNYFGNIEGKYITEKYIYCDMCNNFEQNIDKNLIEEPSEGFNKNNRIEYAFSTAHKANNSFETLVDIYRYYEYNQNIIMATEYRSQIIEVLTSKLEQEPSIRLLLTVVDLHRRNGDFKTALKVAKKSGEISRKDESEEESTLLQLLKIEKSFCKHKDAKKH